MNLDGIERRSDPRTPAYTPITFRCEGQEQEMPAHLLDLSNGGAAVLATTYDAPLVGQYLDLHFAVRKDDENGEESIRRRETGLVVNARDSMRGVIRLGIRFVRHRGMNAELFDPIEILSDHRKTGSTESSSGRWSTARHFDRLSLPSATSN